jgi:hypothetical protein
MVCVHGARGFVCQALKSQSEAGNVLIYRTGHRGLPEEECKP